MPGQIVTLYTEAAARQHLDVSKLLGHYNRFIFVWNLIVNKLNLKGRFKARLEKSPETSDKKCHFHPQNLQQINDKDDFASQLYTRSTFPANSNKRCHDGDLPLAFLLTSCHSRGFCSASRWCGRPRPSLSQLLPVWTKSKVTPFWLVIDNGTEQELLLPLVFCPNSHSFGSLFSITTLKCTCLLTLKALPPLPGELNTLPFSHMLLMFRTSVTRGRSEIVERGDRHSLFSLCGDKRAQS